MREDWLVTLVPRFIVLYSYHAQDENDLSVERGQCVTVLNKVARGLIVIVGDTLHPSGRSRVVLGATL